MKERSTWLRDYDRLLISSNASEILLAPSLEGTCVDISRKTDPWLRLQNAEATLMALEIHKLCPDRKDLWKVKQKTSKI